MADVLLQWIRDHGALGVALFLLVENLGVPWPTTFAYIAAVELVRIGRLTWVEATLICTAGHTAGAAIAFALGLAGDNAVMRRLQRGSGLRRAVEWLHTWYDRHGSVTVFVARQVGQVRPWASFAAGLGEITWAPFLIWTALGSLAHVVSALWLTHVGFQFWEQYPQFRIALVVVLGLAFWSIFVWAIWRGIAERRKARATPEVSEQ